MKRSSGLRLRGSPSEDVGQHPELTRLVTVIADTGQRYLSGELFGDRPVAEEPDRDHRLDDATVAMLEEHRDRLEFLS